MTTTCPSCGEAIAAGGEKALLFCPFCGQSLSMSAPSALEKRLQAEKKPDKKYAIIQDALARHPDDFDANRALLYHGRLHTALSGRKGIDYTAIKCHLMSVFHTPEGYSDAELSEQYEELLHGPQLLRTMALSPDGDAFLSEYLHTLAHQYIDLFLRGNNRNSLLFGFSRPMESQAKRCAVPVQAMLLEISRTPRLTEGERSLLRHAVRAGFARVFPGHAALIDA